MENKLTILIIALVVVGGTLAYALNKKVSYNPPQIGCTMEAKMCDDGSAVGRTGPNCEFAQCPDVKNPSPNPAPNPAPSVKSTKFDTSTTIKVNETVTFSDGLQLTLNKIDDSRCPKDVMCIWAGELAGIFTIKGGQIGATPQEINLATANGDNVSKGAYTFMLKGATDKSMTVTIHLDYVVKGQCYIGGCSGQICSDQKDSMSTCEFRPEYACYKKTSTCERQADKKCGWTDTPALNACLNNPPAL